MIWDRAGALGTRDSPGIPKGAFIQRCYGPCWTGFELLGIHFKVFKRCWPVVVLDSLGRLAIVRMLSSDRYLKPTRPTQPETAEFHRSTRLLLSLTSKEGV